MPNQHIKPEDRSPALQRYYDRKGTPEGDAAAKRQRELDAKRRADPEMKKHIAATHRVWYEEGGGKEKREEQVADSFIKNRWEKLLIEEPLRIFNNGSENLAQ